MSHEQYPAHEGLQVVPAEGLECRDVAAEGGLEVDHSKDSGLEVHHGKAGDDVSPNYQARGSPTICGLKRRVFWIVLGVVIVAAIVAGVVGGVVGARKNGTAAGDTNSSPALSSAHTASPTKSGASTTESQPSTTAQTAYPTTTLALDCPSINGTTHTAKAGGTAYTFDVFCNANFGAGQDSGGRNTSSIDDCMQSCVELLSLGGACVGVVWDSKMNLAIHPRRNCFLKQSRSQFVFTGTKNLSAGALLVAT